MPAGRPSDYSRDVADRICELIVQGYTIREIDKLPNMPGKTAIFRWLVRYPEFEEQYARAKEFRAEDMADELIEIADDGRNDWMLRQSKDGVRDWVADNEVVNRSRLRVDTRKWLMGKLKPKKYGERLQVEHSREADLQAVPYTELQAIAQGRAVLTIEHEATPPTDGAPDASDD